MTDNLTDAFWQHIEAKKDTKIGSKIYNWLNEDNLGQIVVDNKVFWFELTSSYCTMPNYIHDYAIKWAEKLGYKYLYNVAQV